MAYLYLAKQIGIAGALGIWAYIVAKGLFARSSLRLSPAEEIALLAPAGLAIAIGLLFGLGIVGALTGPWILTSAGLLLAFSCWRLRDGIESVLSGTVPAIVRRESSVRLFAIAIACTVLVPVALNALTPPIRSDEVRFHLPYALHFVEQARITPDLYLRFPFFTLNVNLLYAAAIIFGDDVTPHYVHLLLGSLAGLALYVLATPICGRAIALGAVILFFVTPNFSVFAATAYIDLGLAAFITSAIACLDRARERPVLIVCAGLAFGAALGTKYLALALVPLLVAWAAYRTRTGPQVARFAAVAMLTGAPWYVYNLLWTGNPISPFAGDWFSPWPWTAEDLASQTRHLTQERYERSLAGLLLFPYYLVTDSWRFTIQPVPVLLVPGLAALVLLPFWNRHMRPYGVMLLVTIVAWLFSTPYFRYLTAILPVWCLISVWSVERTLWLVVSLATRRHIVPETTRRRVSYAAAAIAIVFAEYHFWLHNRWLDRDAVTERVVHRDQFLLDKIPVYGVAEHLRRVGAQDEVIFAFPPGALFSYARGNRVVGDYFGPMGYGQVFLLNPVCQERLLEQLQLKGVSLLVLSQTFLNNHPSLNNYVTSRLTSEYTDRHADVFRIESSNEPPYGDTQQDSTDSLNAHVVAGEDDIQVIPYFPVASDTLRQGVVRIVNHSDEAGPVVIHGIDDAGTRHGPVVLALGARQTLQFRSDDWVTCNFAKRVSGGLTDNEAGSWWLSLATELDIETLSYIRTEDRFETSHEVARTTQSPDGPTIHHVPFFSPGNQRSQASHLRLINPGTRDVAVTIAGRDDAGEAASEEIHLSLPGRTACWLSATVLESGASDSDRSGCAIISGRLGNRQGRWRLSVAASGDDIQVMSLLENPDGHLTNLSASGGVKSGVHTLPLVFPASDFKEQTQGFARIVNHSDAAGTVEIHGIDDTGVSHGPVALAMNAHEAVHVTSRDLEAGNASKGLPEGLGDGDGYWRLSLATELNIEALGYARTQDGFVTPMQGVAKTTQGTQGETVHYVPFFNPGRTVRQASWLRLSNSGHRDLDVTIAGRDSVGAEAPETVVHLTLPAGQACMLGAQTLESGKPEPGSGRCAGEDFNLAGRFGEGAGKWSLYVVAQGGDLQVMSLLASPTGHLANVSSTNWMPVARLAHKKRLDLLPDVSIVHVERWGPRSTRVGKLVNVQPSGNSTLWFRFRELDPNSSYHVYVGSRPVATTINSNKGFVTARLTRKQSNELVSTERKTPIHLVDPSRGKQLIGHFHVRTQ